MARDCWFKVHRAPGFRSSALMEGELRTRNRGPALLRTMTRDASTTSVTVPIISGGLLSCSLSLLSFRTSRSYRIFWVSIYRLSASTCRSCSRSSRLRDSRFPTRSIIWTSRSCLSVSIWPSCSRSCSDRVRYSRYSSSGVWGSGDWWSVSAMSCLI